MARAGGEGSKWGITLGGWSSVGSQPGSAGTARCLAGTARRGVFEKQGLWSVGKNLLQLFPFPSHILHFQSCSSEWCWAGVT